jgi:anti-anti-sigma factor
VIYDEASKKKPIVINLWDVNYISSVSIGTLIKLHADLAERDIRIGVCQLSDECRKIFEMIEIGNVLPVFEGDEDALKELGG